MKGYDIFYTTSSGTGISRVSYPAMPAKELERKIKLLQANGTVLLVVATARYLWRTVGSIHKMYPGKHQIDLFQVGYAVRKLYSNGEKLKKILLSKLSVGGGSGDSFGVVVESPSMFQDEAQAIHDDVALFVLFTKEGNKISTRYHRIFSEVAQRLGGESMKYLDVRYSKNHPKAAALFGRCKVDAVPECICYYPHGAKTRALRFTTFLDKYRLKVISEGTKISMSSDEGLREAVVQFIGWGGRQAAANSHRRAFSMPRAKRPGAGGETEAPGPAGASGSADTSHAPAETQEQAAS